MLTRSKSGKTASLTDILTTAKPTSPPPSDHALQTSKSMASNASTSSAATIKARKTAAEAVAKRRQLEREQQLADEELARKRQLLALQKQVEDCELQAELAAIEAEGSHSRRSSRRCTEHSQQSHRTEAWVDNVVRNSPFIFDRAKEVTHLSEPNRSHVGIDFPKSNNYIPTQVTNMSEPMAHISPSPHVDIDLSGSNKLLQAVADTAAAAKALAANTHNNTKKNIELTHFSGETSQWLQFKRLFDTTKASFSPLENVARLQQALRGPAREAVAALLVSAYEPDEIICVLEQNFARPEMIVFKEVASMKALPRLGNDLRELGTFATKVRNSVYTIRMLDHVEYLYSPELYHTILGKLNPSIKMRWTDFAVDNYTPSTPKLEILSNFLMREFDRHVKFGLSPEHASILTSSSSYDRHNKREFIHTVTQPKNNSVNKNVNSYVNSAPSSNLGTTATFNTVNINKNCSFCKKLHNIKLCSEFKSLSVEERWQWQREVKACYRCLRRNAHTWKTCKVKPCGVDGCTLHHHPLLHGSQWPNNSISVNVSNDISPEPTPSTSTPNCETRDEKVVISTTNTIPQHSPHPTALLKVVPVTVYGPSGSYDTYAMLDDGSTATLIDASVAARIGASGPQQKIIVNGVGGLTKTVEISYVSFQIKGKYTENIYDVKRARALPSLSLHTQSVYRQNINKYDYLQDVAHFLTYENATPTVLIGAEDWHLSINLSVLKGSRNEPVACLTALGWTLYGLSSSLTKCVQFVNHISFLDQELAIENNNLDFLIKEQYKLDAIGISKYENTHNKQDQRAIDILEATSTRLPTGRFEVGLPWRDDMPHIPDSYSQAMSRYLSLEKRMLREPEFAEAYENFINNMLSKGYAEECLPSTYYNKSKIQNSKHVQFYLPHFGIYHPQKCKLRVVHDAAALNNGVSLNSLLFSGPDLLQNLLHILFRFREGRVALTADIKEMFPQIRIKPVDRDALRFLWRGRDRKQPIREYRMTSLIFGASSSPFTALFIKNKNAMEHQHKCPAAVKAIVEDHYMDDYLGSHDDVEVAAQIASDIVTVHAAACFEMRGWISNDDAALKSIPAELCADKTNQSVSLGNFSTAVRALGIAWDPNTDTLGFRTGLGNELPTQLTKRKVISHLMRVYDPLGLLGPIVVKGRILFQQTWRTNIDWDTEFPPAEAAKWSEWFLELSQLTTIRVPRWYAKAFENEPIYRELHIFTDASESAYACVAYWRLVYVDGSVKLALIASKARVAPLKPVSIPRLELQAALIGSRLAVTVKDSHVKKPSRTCFWTDSTTVLGWLRSDARSFKPFVAHRIGEIAENSEIKDWRWVPTDMNVADDATRVRSIKLDLTCRWFTGPPFLLLSPTDWPTEPVRELPPLQDHSEIKQNPIEMVGLLTDRIELPSTVTVDCSRFSSWLRLVRSTARVHQAARIFRHFVQNSSQIDHSRRSQNTSTTLIPLCPEFMKAAERHILLSTQLDSFSIEFRCIMNTHPIPKNSRLAKLSPVLADDGLLRLAGRIRAVEHVGQNLKTPVLLDGCHPVVRLLVQHYHVKMGHANNETVINELRQNYWLLRLRNTVRSVAHRCLFCRIKKNVPQIPPTGDLPQQRMAHHSRCFTFTGLDYFGPIDVAVGRRREKRYVALFTCMTSRAVHLELVHSLSADSAVLCIRRFIAKRGAPTTIFSDNGTAFVGANRILKEFYNSTVEEFAANNGIGWSFIPPAAPNFGGCWERLVRSVKVALSAALKERAPKEETLLTLLAEAEAIINSRPLTHVSVDPDDQETLTPFHFLIGSSSTNVLPATFDDNVLVGRTEWKKALRLADFFWSRWVKEVLPTMQPRQRSEQHSTTQIAVGDLVLIADSNLPRGLWPRGLVTATHPGRDGVVRVVDVSTAAGTLRRPLCKVVKLILN